MFFVFMRYAKPNTRRGIMEFMSVKEAAERWGVSNTRVLTYIKTRRIDRKVHITA